MRLRRLLGSCVMSGVEPVAPGVEDHSVNFGQPASIIYDDFDNDAHRVARSGIAAEWTIEAASGAVQYRVKMLMVSGATEVQELFIVRLDAGTSTEVMHLSGEAASRFVAFVRSDAFETLQAEAPAKRARLIPDASALAAAYEHEPRVLTALIETAVNARDVVAMAHRQKIVSEFRRMIEDDQYFDDLVKAQAKKSKEGVWQEFFEENPWLLGLGLGSQLLIGWDEQKLEQAVVGADLAGVGKRADAVLRTAGLITLLTLGEIKHHRTELLGKGTYRSGTWAPSSEVSGAIAQSQVTSQLTVERLVNKLERKDANGFIIPNKAAFVYRPKSYVVVGSLGQFVDEKTGGHNEDMMRSFELLRRNLYDPTVLTFDELLARAEALLGLRVDS